MSRYSDALGRAISSIDVFLERETALKTHKNGSSTQLGHLIEDLLQSSKQLHFSAHLVFIATRLGGAQGLRRLIQIIGENEDFFEHLAGNLGLEALYRAERGADRLVPFLETLPAAAPPEVSKRYLADAAICYLLMLDDPCIAMCRAAIEVLVEELDPNLEDTELGEAILSLVPKRISQHQANDMLEINRQAREIMHRTPSRSRPDAADCLKRLSRLLAQLHPA
jgi:hypothetical protein